MHIWKKSMYWKVCWSTIATCVTADDIFNGTYMCGVLYAFERLYLLPHWKRRTDQDRAALLVRVPHPTEKECPSKDIGGLRNAIVPYVLHALPNKAIDMRSAMLKMGPFPSLGCCKLSADSADFVGEEKGQLQKSQSPTDPPAAAPASPPRGTAPKWNYPCDCDKDDQHGVHSQPCTDAEM